MLITLQIFLFIFIVFSPKQVIANSFVDNFDKRDDSMWNYIQKYGKIEYQDGFVEMSSLDGYFPEMYSKKEIFTSPNQELEFTFKFNDRGYYPPSGTGIGVGNTVAGYTFYQYALWRDAASGVHLITNDFGLSKNGYCSENIPFSDLSYRKNVMNVSLKNNDWNTLKIVYLSGGKYSIFVNGQEKFTSLGGQCKPNLITVGNPLSGSNYWNGISIDKISLSEGQINKTILIPGLGASWNEKAMVLNQVVNDNEWKMTPFVNNYDDLIKSLGDNVLVWNYDWRKPVSKIVVDLDEFITKNIGSDEKFEIIGHSLGGVVGRLWLKNHPNDLRLNKVVTLGSPHRGSIDAYRVWSGGNITENVDVSSVALNILLQLQKKNGENKVDTIRQYSPILKDLLPTFNFLKKNGQILINPLVNNDIGDTKLFTFSGRGFNTERWVNLGEKNVFETALGWWPDGKILGYEYADGDGTVLTSSSDLGNNTLLNSDHGSLPYLYLNKTKDLSLNNKWIFYLGSPAKIRLVCAGKEDVVSSDFLVADKLGVDGCKLAVEADGDGVVHLVYGLTNVGQSWGYFESQVRSGEKINFWINNQSFLSEKGYGGYLGEILAQLKNKYPKNLDVSLAIKMAEKSNWTACLESLFHFRKDTGERGLSNLVVEAIAMNISGDKAHTNTELLSQISRNITQSSANSYVFREELIYKLSNLNLKLDPKIDLLLVKEITGK